MIDLERKLGLAGKEEGNLKEEVVVCGYLDLKE
jgi:hypothetical protein